MCPHPRLEEQALVSTKRNEAIKIQAFAMAMGIHWRIGEESPLLLLRPTIALSSDICKNIFGHLKQEIGLAVPQSYNGLEAKLLWF